MQLSSQNKANHLITETSPYLLQHAYNPVNWYPWNETTFQKAKEKNRPLLISIGYSSCHWCHVMERESFEDNMVAQQMNDHFICIKVDREERPDVDQIYMDAVHLLGMQGGWPLNCFALPDGRPFWGGTYYPKAQWMELLSQVAFLYKNDYQRVKQQAEELTKGLSGTNFLAQPLVNPEFSMQDASEFTQKILKQVDLEYGGLKGFPKFPMPSVFQFLLYYSSLLSQNIPKEVTITLEKMAKGGIYDQLGGGFSRYSTDVKWRIPHFEKMLYDNAQLVSLYSNACRINPNNLYRKVIISTLQFIKDELTAPDGGFYSALDADSEGKEGLFYCWQKEELQEILKEDYFLFADYYQIETEGVWENGLSVLFPVSDVKLIAKKYNLLETEIEIILEKSLILLRDVRKKRVRPGLDDKQLASWNALTIKAFADAYAALQDEFYLQKALSSAEVFEKHFYNNKKGGLFHSFKNGQQKIEGLLEDYAFCADAYLSLYQLTFDSNWLFRAKEIADYSLAHFWDEKNGLFYFSGENDPTLIVRKHEIYDGVIPSFNAIMMKVLFLLGHYFEDENLLNICKNTLSSFTSKIKLYPQSFSAWATLWLYHASEFFTVAITGTDALNVAKELSRLNLSNTIIAASTFYNNLPILKNKHSDSKTTIYICNEVGCFPPVNTVKKALQIILKKRRSDI